MLGTLTLPSEGKTVTHLGVSAATVRQISMITGQYFFSEPRLQDGTWRRKSEEAPND